MHTRSGLHFASLLVAMAIGCGTSTTAPAPADTGSTAHGTATIDGTFTTVPLNSKTATAVARSEPPGLELKISPQLIACGGGVDEPRIMIDLGGAAVGVYPISKGFPFRADLTAFQARARACPSGAPVPTASDAGTDAGSADAAFSPICSEGVRSGQVEITRLDADVGGTIEGTFDIVFPDGEIKGTFSALRCS